MTPQEYAEQQTRENEARSFRLELKNHEDYCGSKALAKACSDDPFDYCLRVRTGEVINFSGAHILGNGWIRITLKPMDEQPEVFRVAYPAMRGMDVRIADIVWVMDAPEGS